MNKDQMVSRVLGILGETEEGTYESDLIYDYIDTAQDSLMNDVALVAPHFLHSTEIITTTAGVSIYSLTGRLVADPAAVKLTHNGDEIPYNIEGIDLDYDPNGAVEADLWEFRGFNSIKLYPRPLSVTNYTVFGKFLPAYLGETLIDGALPQSTLPLDLQTIVCYRAAIEAAGALGDAGSQLPYIMRTESVLYKNWRGTVLTRVMPKKGHPLTYRRYNGYYKRR